MSDEAYPVYKGVRIRLQPRALRTGRWKADFKLLQDVGSETIVTPHHGPNFASREDAVNAALRRAQREIDKTH